MKETETPVTEAPSAPGRVAEQEVLGAQTGALRTSSRALPRQHFKGRGSPSQSLGLTNKVGKGRRGLESRDSFATKEKSGDPRGTPFRSELVRHCAP